MLRFPQQFDIGATDARVDHDRPILVIEEVEGFRRDIETAGVSTASVLINLDFHVFLESLRGHSDIANGAVMRCGGRYR